MIRSAIDRLVSFSGIVIAAVLLVAGVMLSWGQSYVHGQVHDQLAAQKIFFPPQGSESLSDPKVGPYLNKYAGQQLVTGEQAKAYADHFIKVHLDEMTGGQTYAQLSTKALASPDDQKLAAQVNTVFRGETLRGLLLNAYAFDTMASIAFIASIVAYLGAGLMLLLAGIGFGHARSAGKATEVPAYPAREMINA